MARLRKADVPSSAGRKHVLESDESEAERQPPHLYPGHNSIDSGYKSREGSPAKVHFPRRLEQGPTVSNPALRQQSPARSSMNQRNRQIGNLSPGSQLQEEAAHQQNGARHSSPARKGQSYAPSTAYARPAASKSKTTDAAQEGWLPELQLDKYLETPPSLDDDALCREVEGLKGRILSFAREVPAPMRDEHKKLAAVDALLFDDQNANLIRYIGYLAQGGKEHLLGWANILTHEECLQALVVGILSRALKEHVFGELFFGATEDLEDELQKQQQDLIGQDGFFRAEKRAHAINRHKSGRTEFDSFQEAVGRLTAQLAHLLLPLWRIGGKHAEDKRFRPQLKDIVTVAANLSRCMRTTGGAVYHWTTSFKDEEFDPSRIECLNLTTMIQNSPYEKSPADDYEPVRLKSGHGDREQAIVQIVCFPSLTAYRRGGGELAQKYFAEEQAAEPRHNANIPPELRAQHKRVASQDQLTGDEGFRTTTICKSVVHLQWGMQSLLTEEAGTSFHSDAMNKRNGQSMDRYEDDRKGCVELWDVYKAVQGGKTIFEVVDEYNGKGGTVYQSLRGFLPGG